MSNNSVISAWENWENLTGLLSEWQRAQLEKIDNKVGIRCLLDMWLNSTNYLPEGLYCNATWDNVYCWPPTAAGTKITILCSEAFQQNYPEEAVHLEGNAYRYCQENGSWSQGVRTNYDECANSFESKRLVTTVANPVTKNVFGIVQVVQYLLFFGSSLSLICLCTSLAIFFTYRCLRCDRVIINIHLMIALVIRFILLVLITEPFVLKRDTSYRDVDWVCKAVICVYLYGTVASVSWMFIQGLYINNSLTTVVPTGVSTQKHFNIYYLIGWALPAVLLSAYTISMIYRTDQHWCWKGYAGTDEMWILTAPMMFALLINLGFLLNIARIVFRKVRRSRNQGESSQLKATVKATGILFFVLGVNNLLLPFNPGGKYEDAYIVLNTIFGSTQGTVVAFLYCFCNPEVHDALRRSYNRYQANRSVLRSGGRRLARRRFNFCTFASRGVDRPAEIDLPEFV